MKRVICWDLWGTLIRSAYKGEMYEDYLAQFVDREQIRAIVRSKLMTRDASGLMEEGGFMGLPYGGYAKRLCDTLLGHLPEMERRTICLGISDRWDRENNGVCWIRKGALALQKMQRTSPSDVHVLLSNTTEEGWKDVNTELLHRGEAPVSFLFGRDNLVLSCDLTVAKPDPYVWQKVEWRYPDANEYWMIGDDPVIDIAVPAAMGWKTILVNHPNGVPVTDVPKIIGGKR